MKKMIQKIINKCGCIDIKIVIFLFFLLAIIYAQYGEQLKDDCDCN